MWDEAIIEIRAMNLNDEPHNIKTKFGMIQIKLKFIDLMFNLPDKIKEAKDLIDDNQSKKDKFVRSQEGITN